MDPRDEIKKLAEVRKDVERGSYLNPFKARDHIQFLLSLYDKLGEMLMTVQKMNEEVVRNAYTTKRGGEDGESSNL
jgi:hypothetical protein